MKIYDCFTYFDEDLILDARLNIMNNYVDYFVIVESTYNHNGERRELKFDLNKHQKFKNKIKYIVWDNKKPSIVDSNTLITTSLQSSSAVASNNCISSEHSIE